VIGIESGELQVRERAGGAERASAGAVGYLTGSTVARVTVRIAKLD
jgi:hypothetical protein